MGDPRAFLLCLVIAAGAHAEAAGAHAAAGPEPAAQALQASLNAAIAAGASSFAIPSAEYVFGASAFRVGGAAHMRIEAAPRTTLWFSVGGGVRFEGCTNVTFVGNALVVDYDPLPFWQATVVAVEQNASGSGAPFAVRVRSDAGFADPLAFWSRWKADARNEFIQGPQWWDGASGAGLPLISQSFSQWDAPAQMGGKHADGSYLYTCPGITPVPGATKAAPAVGDKVTAIIRVGYTWNLHRCAAVSVSNVTIHAASSMSITEFDGCGPNAYDAMRVVRRAAGSSAMCGPHGSGTRACRVAVAANADCFHSSGMRRGPAVTRCEFSYAMDDFANVHSRAQVSLGVVATAAAATAPGVPAAAAAAAAATTLLVADPRLQRDHGILDDDPYGTVETLPNAKVGDAVTLRDARTLVLVAAGTIASLTRATPADAWAQGAQAALDGMNSDPALAPLSPHYQAFDVGGVGVTDPRVWRVAVAVRPAAAGGAAAAGPDLNRTLLFELSDWDASGASFVDNRLHNGIDGLRWKSSGGLIARNVWHHAERSLPANRATGLELTPLRSFLEGPLAISGVRVVNNTIYGGGSAAAYITQCEGMGHAHAGNAFPTCTNNTVAGNAFPPPPGGGG